MLEPYRTNYIWLSQVYTSVKPASGDGKLLWHALGAKKTLDLVHRNVHVEEVRDDLDTLVMDAGASEKIITTDDSGVKGKEIEIKIVARLKSHAGNPEFVALGEMLERLRERHEQGIFNSIEFLKNLLSMARDVIEAEQRVDSVDELAQAKAALTELFSEVKNRDTPVIVERVVEDIDRVLQVVRFDGWQATNAGERRSSRNDVRSSTSDTR